MEWKKKRKEKKAAEDAKILKEKEQQLKAGRSAMASGRELFVYNPDLFKDDEDAADMDYTTREEDEKDHQAATVGHYEDDTLDQDLTTPELKHKQPHHPVHVDESLFKDIDDMNLEDE
jgi:hypothetical protein